MTTGHGCTTDAVAAGGRQIPAGPGVAAIAAACDDAGVAAFDDMQHGGSCSAATTAGIVADVVAMRAAHIDDAGAGHAFRAQDSDTAAGRAG